MSQLNKIIDNVQKRLGVKADISPERMKVLEDVMKGKISPAEAKKIIQKQFDDAPEEE